MPDLMVQHGFIVFTLWLFGPGILFVMFINWMANLPTRQEVYLRKRLKYRPGKDW